MADRLELAVVGLGRLGAVHSLHAAELAAETGLCRLSAIVEADVDRARASASEFAAIQGSAVEVFGSIAECIEAGTVTAAVISTPTAMHRSQAMELLEAGKRVLLEKPLTASLDEECSFAAELDAHFPDGVMLGFQRRFDAPMQFAKRLVDEGAIGRTFKIVTALEDSGPLPDGYKSVGLLPDMSVHNVDEVLWFFGDMPTSAVSSGSRIYAYSLTAADEDFDDASIELRFPGNRLARITASRNHVSGYRVESWIYGELGQIHIGEFARGDGTVIVEAYGREAAIARKVFSTQKYDGGLPEFVNRFGDAYKSELTTVRETVFGRRTSPVITSS